MATESEDKRGVYVRLDDNEWKLFERAKAEIKRKSSIKPNNGQVFTFLLHEKYPDMEQEVPD